MRASEPWALRKAEQDLVERNNMIMLRRVIKRIEIRTEEMK